MRASTIKVILFALAIVVTALVVIGHAPEAQSSPPLPPPSSEIGGWVCVPNGDHKLCKWSY